MGTQTRRAPSEASANGDGKPTLPPITTAKFEEAGRLIERLIEEKSSVFVEKAASYRESHRQGTSRQLNAQEAAQITAGLAHHMDGNGGADLGAMAAEIQQSDLRAYDEPTEQEVLMVAGVATAPEFIDIVQRFVALVEMPSDRFREAREGGTLDEAIDDAVREMAYLDVKDEARPRAIAALTHFSEAAGAGGPGEAWALISQVVAAAWRQAMSASPSSSPTSSLVDTGGDDSTSSTGSLTGMPSTT